MTLMTETSRAAMNSRLREVADGEKPDLLFAVMFRDELDPAVIRHISAKTNTVTLNWFCDDHWRFESFSRRWAPEFNWVVTTARSALPKYKAIGYERVIKSQWAANHFSYRRLDLPPEYDVSFVGQPHGDRRDVVEFLRRNGVDVRTWGAGWEAGRVTQEELVHVFNRSRINLNLANASSRSRLRPWKRWEQQIKGRNFEIPACGGFQLSGTADDLASYLEPDREISLFADRRQLLAKIRLYLDDVNARKRMAQAAHRRVLAEHTWAHRFEEIFDRIGLPPSVGSSPV
jgi:spore maturation protein CgeB